MNSKSKTTPLRKYSIYDRLQDLTKKDYEKALIDLPELLNVKKRQFLNYVYAKPESTTIINSEQMLVIAQYFSCTMEQLFTSTEDVNKKVSEAKNSNDYSFLK